MPSDHPQNTHILILGATGFVGRWVAHKALQDGTRVTLCARDLPRAQQLMKRWGHDAALQCLDVSDFSAVKSTVLESNPDLVINLAGYGIDRSECDETLAHRINAELPGILAEILPTNTRKSEQRLRLLHIGSALEYGEVAGDLSESGPHDPTTLYGLTKKLGTDAVHSVAKDRSLCAMTARLFTVYGAGEHSGRLLPELLRINHEGGALELTAGLQKRDFCHVKDVAQALTAMATLPQSSVAPGMVSNLASGKLITVRQFAERAASVLGISDDQLRFGSLPTRQEEMEHQPVNLDRIHSLGIESLSSDIEKGVRVALESQELMTND